MAIYSEKFAAAVVPVGVTTVWTVPTDGATYIIRDIVLASNLAGTTLIILDSGGVEWLDSFFPTGIFQVKHTECRIVMAPGEVVQTSCVGGVRPCGSRATGLSRIV